MTDSAGKALRNVAVNAIPWELRSPAIVASAGGLGVSDENGYFEIAGLFPGEYVVEAGDKSPLPWNPGPYRLQYFPNADWLEDAKPVVVKNEKEIPQVNFSLPGPLAQKTISVRVTFADGKPARTGR